VQYVPGITREIICPSCRAHVDTTSKQGQVLEVASHMEHTRHTLELGAKATISGSEFELIGVMDLQDDEEAGWSEYLLYSPRAGLLWLVETDDGWFRSKVQDEWPQWDHGDKVMLGTQKFSKLYDYDAKVVYAAGAFNWRVSVGDSSHLFEFESGKTRLAAELTGDELNWSVATPIPADQIRAWFGADVKTENLEAETDLETVGKYFLYGLGIVNLIPLLMETDGTMWYFIFAAAAIYLPALVLSKSKVETPSGDDK
jgi:hypothetical protein